MTSHQNQIIAGENVPSRAAVLYNRLATSLNGFFAAHTSEFCSDCLAFHRIKAADDPIARHILADGFFPGCCQEGVAEDKRVHCAGGLRLPEPLWEAICANRPPRESRAAPEYAVRDEKDGKIHRGRGCVWLGPGGCVLGGWKSPICLAYLCPPLIEELSARSGTAVGEDFLGLSRVFAEICSLAEGKAAGTDAEGALAKFEVKLAAFGELLGSNYRSRTTSRR